jgi:U2 small nuclear ribonucleoprotein A'
MRCRQNEDAIDFTDNDLPALANFPKNHRLKALYLGRNRITAIAPGLHNSIPNLDTLVLTQNSLSELADLAPLADLKKLTHLTLLENPVASREVSHTVQLTWQQLFCLTRRRTTVTGSSLHVRL